MPPARTQLLVRGRVPVGALSEVFAARHSDAAVPQPQSAAAAAAAAAARLRPPSRGAEQHAQQREKHQHAREDGEEGRDHDHDHDHEQDHEQDPHEGGDPDEDASLEAAFEAAEEEAAAEGRDTATPTAAWLAACAVSLSADGTALAVASGHTVAFLLLDEAQGEPKFELKCTCKAVLKEELVTDVYCLRLATARSQCAIVVAFDSGYLRVYSQEGQCILSHMLHTGPIMKIRTQPSGASHDDLAVLYHQAIIVVDGFRLEQCIITCMAAQSVSSSVVGNPQDVTSIAFKKWGIPEQERTMDVACCGIQVPSAYDRLVSSSGAPAEPAQRYVVAGFFPMLSVYTTAGCERPHFSAAALATSVATKLSEAMLGVVTSFWGVGKRSQPVAKPESKSKGRENENTLPPSALEPCTDLPVSFSLNDRRRSIQTIVMDPFGDTAAATDEYGRVMLIDLTSVTIVRVWKGYRDAKCGWILAEQDDDDDDEVEDPLARRLSSSTAEPSKRKCAFLVIHAPRRGILEVWNTRLGPRVAAFNVGADCLVVPAACGIGADIPAGSGLHHTAGKCLLLRGNGELTEVRTPLRAAWSESTSNRAHDRTVLRGLLDVLAGTQGQPPAQPVDLPGVFKTLHGTEALREALVMICAPNFPRDQVDTCLAAVESKLAEVAKDGASSIDVLDLQTLVCIRQRQHQAWKLLSGAPTPTALAVDSSVSLAGLNLQHGEARRLEAHLQLSLSNRGGSSDQDANPALPLVSPAAFFNAFDVTCPQTLSLKPQADEPKVPLVATLPDEERRALASTLFRAVPYADDLELFREAIGLSALTAEDCLSLFVTWTLQLPLSYLLHVRVFESLYMLLGVLETLNGAASTPNKWWQFIHEECASCTQIPQALCLTLMSKALQDLTGRGQGIDFSLLQNQLEDVGTLLYALRDTQVADASRWSVKQLSTGSLRMTNVIVDHLLNLGLVPEDVNLLDVPDTQNEERERSIAMRHVRLLNPRFPQTCCPDGLRARCCFELVRRWKETPTRLECLTLAVRFLVDVKHATLAEAVSMEVWSSALKQRMALLVNEVQKMGKAMKERLCLKFFQLNRPSLCQLIKLAEHVLVGLERFGGSDDAPLPHLVDERWSGQDGGSSALDKILSAATQEHPRAFVPLVRQHVVLMRVVGYIMRSNMRSVKPLALFADTPRAALFSPLAANEEHPTARALKESTKESTSARENFVARVIAQSVTCLVAPVGDPFNVTVTEAYSLADDLRVPQDVARIRHIVNLFEIAHDHDAEELILQVEDTPSLGAALVDVARRRLAACFAEDDFLSLLSQLPPDVYTWTQGASSGSGDSTNCEIIATSLDSACGFLRRVISLLPPTHASLPQLSSALSACEDLTSA